MGIQRLDMSGAVIEEAGGVVYFALAFFPGLAVFHAQDAADFLAVVLQGIADVFQPFAAGFKGIGVGQPQGLLAGFDRIQYVLLRHRRHFGNHLARGRIVDIKGAATGAVCPAPANVAGKILQQW